MSLADYSAPMFDYSLGPEWKVIFAKTGILDQHWSVGLKYYGPSGNVYGTYTYIDKATSLTMYPAQFHQMITESVYKMKAAILCKMEEYKLQDGVEPPPFGLNVNPAFTAPPPRRDVDKYDYLLEEAK